MNKLSEEWRNYFEEYNGFLYNKLEQFVRDVKQKTNNLSEKYRYFLAGNGASAAISSHIANDFSKTLGLRASTFHDPSVITCLANDYGYNNWLKEAVKIHCQKNDILILISSSGHSENILRAAKTAKKKGLVLISLTGPKPNENIFNLSDVNLKVESSTYNIIECCHMIALCGLIDSLKKIKLAD